MIDTVIETERLSLRKLTHADFADMFAIWGDAETLQYYPNPLDETAVRALLDRILQLYTNHGFGVYAVIRKADGQFVGDCGLAMQDVDGVAELEVLYQFNKQYWGNGYATEAARACLDYAFQQLGRTRIISLIRPENMPSRRVAERNGMRIEKETMHAGLRHFVYVAPPENLRAKSE